MIRFLYKEVGHTGRMASVKVLGVRCDCGMNMFGQQ